MRKRLGTYMWVAGMLGVVAVTLTALPALLATIALPAPMWVLMVASIAQSGVLLAVAVWGGVMLAQAVGLRAPAFEAAARGYSPIPALKPQLAAGLMAGVLGGVLLYIVSEFGPAAFVRVQQQFEVPIIARVLYGGITEEVLLRWGFMTALAWSLWRWVQRREGPVRSQHIWIANALSAVVFGVGHLPAASLLMGGLQPGIALFVVGVNAVFGLLFGFLYSRYGLECAMIAHALAHVVNYVAHLG